MFASVADTNVCSHVPATEAGDRGSGQAAVRVHQRARRGQRLAGLEQRLQPGEDLRPAAVDLLVGALGQLVVGHRQPARVADLLDLPRHPRGALGLDVLAPQRAEALHEPARRIDLEVLALAESAGPPAGCDGLVARARRPVGRRPRRRSCTSPHVGVGDRLPQPLGRGLDVDLEDLLHGRLLQSCLEAAERGRPGLGVLAHPPVVDEPDRDGVQEVELLAAPPLGHHEPGLLEHLAGAS